jgi:hypothetical protein
MEIQSNGPGGAPAQQNLEEEKGKGKIRNNTSASTE